jgi:hypothetical protein
MEPTVLGLLAEVGHEPQLIHATVNSWNTANLNKRQLQCHETATHYKWFIYYHDKLGYRVWLHQYKLPADRRVGHAEVPHNHRYSLASVVLRGGFTHHRFEREDGKLEELKHERQSFSRGDVYMVKWPQLHRLSELVDHTVTLVVESPTARHYSEAFYDDLGEPSVFHDFVELHPRLSADIASLCGAST